LITKPRSALRGFLFVAHHIMDKELSSIFDSNRAWARASTADDPEFFTRLQHQQAPDYLWIGCADSRVPANQIVGLLPGELFVHRNVANVVVHSDLNCLSVLQYAVDVLKVEHVIVCGHYGCGGVAAAYRDDSFGLIDNWLRHVQDVSHKYRSELAKIIGEPDRIAKLCELNVMEQVANVGKTTIMQDAWRRGQSVSLHGLIYDIRDGLLKRLTQAIDARETLNQLIDSFDR
jgi:carbonic anhydrase